MTQGGVKWKLRQILFWAGSQSQIIYQLWLHLFSTFPLALLLEKKDCLFPTQCPTKKGNFSEVSSSTRHTLRLWLVLPINAQLFTFLRVWSISAAFIHHQSCVLLQSIDWCAKYHKMEIEFHPDCIFSLFQSWVVFDFRDAENFHKIKKSSRFPKLSSKSEFCVVFLQVCILIGKVLPWLLSMVLLPHKLCSFCLSLCHKRNFKSQGEIDWKGVEKKCKK